MIVDGFDYISSKCANQTPLEYYLDNRNLPADCAFLCRYLFTEIR